MVPRVAAVFLAVTALFLSGCTGSPFTKSNEGFAEWTPVKCDPTKQELRNVVRGKTPDPNGDLNAAAKRFGEALGDPILGKTSITNTEGRTEWRTTHGTIQSRHAIDDQTILEYNAKRQWPGLDAATGKANLEAFASAMGLPGEKIINYTAKDAGQYDGRIHQAVGGHAVGTVATQVTYVERNQVDGAFVRVMLRPFWVLPTQERVVNDTIALQIAQHFMRCQLDAVERTNERGYQHRYTGLVFDFLPLHNKTVSYVVTSRFHNPMGGACPSEKSEGTMYIDAWTGTVVTWDWNRCSKTSTPA